MVQGGGGSHFARVLFAAFLFCFVFQVFFMFKNNPPINVLAMIMCVGGCYVVRAVRARVHVCVIMVLPLAAVDILARQWP